MKDGPGLKMYFLLKIRIFQPAMLVYQGVTRSTLLGLTISMVINHLLVLNSFPKMPFHEFRSTRWAPTSYNWGNHSYYPISRVMTPVTTGRGPPWRNYSNLPRLIKCLRDLCPFLVGCFSTSARGVMMNLAKPVDVYPIFI